jgi:hypothetical protein
MKYLFFFNGQLLLLCCVCCKIAIQDFMTRLHKKNKKNLRFHRRVHRRTITRRYFTESWKQITGVCHNHRRSHWRPITRRYFTKSSKKITGVCHNHRRRHRRPITRRYFTESSKKITGVCHNHQRNCRWFYWRTHQQNTHTPKRTHVRHVSIVQTYRRSFRRIEKSGGIFEIFWCAYQLIAAGI